MVSVDSFNSSSTQHDVHLVNYDLISLKIEDKAEYALGRGYLVIDRLLPQQAVISFVQPFGSCSIKRHSRESLPVSTLSLLFIRQNKQYD